MRLSLNNKLNFLSYYQLIGGVMGLGITIWLIAKTEIVSGLLMLILNLAMGLYVYSIYCGQKLLRSKSIAALKLSKYNQLIQVASFAALGFTFKFVSGLSVSLGIDYTHEFKFLFKFSLSEFEFNINNKKELVQFGVNLIAIYMVYLIDQLLVELQTQDQNSEIFFEGTSDEN